MGDCGRRAEGQDKGWVKGRVKGGTRGGTSDGSHAVELAKAQ